MDIDAATLNRLIAEDAARPAYSWDTSERAEAQPKGKADADDAEIPTWLRALLWAVPVAAAADMATTEALIAKGGVGGEANPLMRNKAMRWGVKPALAAGISLGALGLAKKGKKAQAVTLAILPIAGWGAAAAHNMTQFGKVK